MAKLYFLWEFLLKIRLQRLFLSSCTMLLLFGMVPPAFAQEIGPEGWTELNPASASKVLYVSSSEGDDATAQVYAMPATELGSDPRHPAQGVKAFKTIAAAESQVAQEEAAWILLKAGDTFYEVLNIKSGKSAGEPAIYSYYGGGSEPPLLKTGAKMAIRKDRGSTFKDLKHVHS